MDAVDERETTGEIVAFLQAEAEQLREQLAEKQAEVEGLRTELDGMTKARDRFCSNINQIARMFWGDDKDSYAPDAVIRAVERLRGEHHLVWAEIDKLPSHYWELSKILHEAAEKAKASS